MRSLIINKTKIAIKGLKSSPLYDGMNFLIGVNIGLVILYKKSAIIDTINWLEFKILKWISHSVIALKIRSHTTSPAIHCININVCKKTILDIL
jgi:hypothetical protein